VPRTEDEGYMVSYVAGTHISENAGAGCTHGDGATGANDCIVFEVGADETLVTIGFVDDSGALVGAQIYEDFRGVSIDHGVICGGPESFSVHPGALLLVSIHTGSDCSNERPSSGRVIAEFS
jgi:hypothetical protein